MTPVQHFPDRGAFTAVLQPFEGDCNAFAGAFAGVLAPTCATRPRRALRRAAFFGIRELAAGLEACASAGRGPLGKLCKSKPHEGLA